MKKKSSKISYKKQPSQGRWQTPRQPSPASSIPGLKTLRQFDAQLQNIIEMEQKGDVYSSIQQLEGIPIQPSASMQSVGAKPNN